MSRDTTYFVSDAHFGIDLEGQNDRERLFIDFLRSIAPSAESLFIVGDLFDFWIEYPHAIRPDYFAILHALKTITDQGIPVHYFAGNHDFALGHFLTNTMNFRIYESSFETELQGKKVHISHGDGLLRDDRGYRILRRLLRNGALQGLYKMMPPDWGVPLGIFFSGSSRKYLRRKLSPDRIAEYRSHAVKRLEQGNDIVVFGHTHEAEHSRFNDKTYVNTGAWLRHYNYASLTNGEIRLWSYRDGTPAEEIPPVDRNKGSRIS